MLKASNAMRVGPTRVLYPGEGRALICAGGVVKVRSGVLEGCDTGEMDDRIGKIVETEEIACEIRDVRGREEI